MSLIKTHLNRNLTRAERSPVEVEETVKFPANCYKGGMVCVVPVITHRDTEPLRWITYTADTQKVWSLFLYTEDAGLPYFDRASVTANGYW